MTKKHKKPNSPPPSRNLQTPRSRIRPVQMTGPRHYLQHARDYPIMGCWIMEGWQEHGITPVVIARQQAPDKVIFAVYMMDIYCLGVKDAFANADLSLAKFERELPKMCAHKPIECSVELAHEVVYGGMEYAARYGFHPHRDFTDQFCDQVLDPPDAHPRSNNVVFGHEGKPFYLSGPYDNQWKINTIINTLRRTAGEGNFHYVIGLGDPEVFDD